MTVRRAIFLLVAPWIYRGLLETIGRDDIIDYIGEEPVSKRRRRRIRGKARAGQI